MVGGRDLSFTLPLHTFPSRHTTLAVSPPPRAGTVADQSAAATESLTAAGGNLREGELPGTRLLFGDEPSAAEVIKQMHTEEVFRWVWAWLSAHP